MNYNIEDLDEIIGFSIKFPKYKHKKKLLKIFELEDIIKMNEYYAVKINDLQRENIRLAQQINGKNDTLNVKIKELEKLVNKHGSKRHKTIIKLLKSHIASVDPRIYDKVGKLYDEINKILYHRNDR